VITRKLPCILTDEEVLERGEQLAAAEHAYTATDNERKEAAKRFKNALTAIDRRLTELSDAIRDRVESRDVECRWALDFNSDCRLLLRVDTGEQIESVQGIPDADRQQALGLDSFSSSS